MGVAGSTLLVGNLMSVVVIMIVPLVFVLMPVMSMVVIMSMLMDLRRGRRAPNETRILLSFG